MEFWLWVTIGMMALALTILAVKNHMLRRSAREIRDAFAEKLITDTNTLIDISCGDRQMRILADSINRQLCQLQEERHRFQQGDQELKNAVANISHDLRTPLTAICAYLDLLEQEETSDKARRYLAQIQNRTDALKSLTEELFRYSVVTSSLELKPERVNLVTALQDSLLSFYGMIRRKGLQPQIELPDTPVWRLLDTGALNRVFSNIISNALKYTDGDFAVLMKQDGTIIFSNTAKNMDPLLVGRLFDRFYTVDAARNSTGLGLSIAKLLTERMGGLIRAGCSNGTLSVTVQFKA